MCLGTLSQDIGTGWRLFVRAETSEVYEVGRYSHEAAEIALRREDVISLSNLSAMPVFCVEVVCAEFDSVRQYYNMYQSLESVLQRLCLRKVTPTMISLHLLNKDLIWSQIWKDLGAIERKLTATGTLIFIVGCKVTSSEKG